MKQEHKLELIADKLTLAQTCLEMEDFAGASKLYDDCIKLTQDILTEIQNNKVEAKNHG